jgi:hypothetical protein
VLQQQQMWQGRMIAWRRARYGRQNNNLFIKFSFLQDLTFTSCAVAHFNCLVLFLSNLLLLAYFSVALAGALDQSSELATSYTLIPRCDSTNRKTAG